MDKTTPPSAKLASLLAEAETQRMDESARRFIDIAEQTFATPTDLVTAVWPLKQGTFTFSRPAHQFSEYEKFVYKFALIAAGLGILNEPASMRILAAAVYSGGSATIEGRSTGDVSDYVAVHELVKSGNEHYTPPKLVILAAEVNAAIEVMQRPETPISARRWLALHVPAPPGENTDSLIFSSARGQHGLPLGLNPATRETLYYIGEASLVTIAPSGRGKTQCHVLPTLASYPGPVIVLDIKGECFEQTAAWRRQNVGPVIRFNPVEPESSANYNPLALVDDSPDELWESSRFLADLLIVPRSLNEPGWETQGRDLLTLIIAFVVLVHEPEERHMGLVLDLIATVGLDDMLDGVGASHSRFPAAMRRVAARFRTMAENAPKQFEGVLGGASQHLQLWEGPKLERVTRRNDWQPDDFAKAPFPSLYLCIPPNAIESYASVLRVVIGQHVRRLMRMNSKPQVPILFMLDELPRLGRMQPIREALEVGRSYGIKLWMFAQYAEQLIQAYPDVGEGLIDSCDVRMYMNPPPRTAEKISRAFGKMNNVLEGSKGPALEPTQITGPEHREAIFVLAANETPLVLQKRYFHAS